MLKLGPGLREAVAIAYNPFPVRRSGSWDRVVLKTSENQVDIWKIHLDIEESAREFCRSLLSPDEEQRAHRFYFEIHRQRFIVARAALRHILSQYIGLPPQQLAFSYGANGKPRLLATADSGIRFNLSHSDDHAVLAVTQRSEVGVDIERVDSEFATTEIAERFFSPNEVVRLLALSPHERTEAFFACWTRKEAYVKALGGGLSVPLDSFEVSFGPGNVPALLHVKPDDSEVARWSLYNIEAPWGYKAALVIAGKGHQLRDLHWQQPAAGSGRL